MYVRKKQYIWLMGICLMGALLIGCKNEAGFLPEEQMDMVVEEHSQEGQMVTEEEATGQQKETVEIYVQVSGAVVNPGVYQLPAESRVFEAVELAGGMTKEADFASVNQAQILSDGQQVYIYTIGEAKKQETPQNSSEDGKVNLNTATAEELMSLPGIGQSKADSIIAFREENGGFSHIEELMNITGIKEGVYTKIKDRIKIN